MKSSFYLKHDLDSREDPKLRPMLMKFGARGYGIYWMIVEDLYRNGGRVARDYPTMSWAYHEAADAIRAVIEDFDLFFDAEGRVGCHRVDRGLSERQDASAQSRIAGKISAAIRASKASSTAVQPGEERRGEEGEDKTSAPSAVDFQKLLETAAEDASVEKFFSSTERALDRRCAIRGVHYGHKFIDIPAIYAEGYLTSPKLKNMGKLQREGFQARVDLKKSESR